MHSKNTRSNARAQKEKTSREKPADSPLSTETLTGNETPEEIPDDIMSFSVIGDQVLPREVVPVPEDISDLGSFVCLDSDPDKTMDGSIAKENQQGTPQINFNKERLQVVVDPGFINLYGIILDGKTLVVGFGFGTPPLTKNSEQLPKCSETEHESELSKEDLMSVKRVSSKSPTFFDSIQALYPAGIDHIGLLGIKNGISIQESVIKKALKDIQVTNTPPYFEKDSENDELHVYYFHDGTLHTSSYKVMTTEEFKEKFCFLNILGAVTVELPTRNKPSNERLSVMQDLAKKISEEMIFRIGKSGTFIPLNPILQSHHSTIGKVFDSSEKHKDYRTGMEVLNIYGFFPSTIEAHSESSVQAPFVIDYNHPKISKKPHDANSQQICYGEESHKLYLNVELPFDGLCVVYRERSIHDAYNLFIDAAERIIYLAELHVNSLSLENDPYRIQDLCVYHFSPEELGHPISLIYTPDDPDNELGKFVVKPLVI